MNRRIFIIDDEPNLVKIATKLLQDKGYLVSSATHPTAGLHKILADPPDLILLDVALPDKDGIEVCKELKENAKTASIPIIMISVRADETDVVLGLEAGAIDYISKPYRKHELLARVKTALGRKEGAQNSSFLKMGGLKLDLSQYKAWLDDIEIHLTLKEFELLSYFVRREGQVMTRGAISQEIWGVDFKGTSRAINFHVEQLRKKLGRYGNWIQSLRGVGYRLEADEKEVR